MNRVLVKCTNYIPSSIPLSFALPTGSIASINARCVQRVLPNSPRLFSIATKLRSQPEQQSSPQIPNDAATPPPASESSIPWYLQVETPAPPASTSPLIALQEIPPIPEDAPAILSPVLTHLSTQIGLDNITLLDLRHLDPPPALGANLIMIIGTARSVKHLNVSADRFCRWCRSTYKLRPYADGLLGRNELKLKLRRRARRLKLAQSVGNTVAMEGRDDGITTGWVCVNMGPVDEVEVQPNDTQTSGEIAEAGEARKIDVPGENEEEYNNPNPDDAYVGFGSRHAAPRIVVQMFTEEKRLEMDLEGLWDVRNARRRRREEKQILEDDTPRDQSFEDRDGERFQSDSPRT